MAALTVPNSTQFEVDKEMVELFDKRSEEIRQEKKWKDRLSRHQNGKEEWKTKWK